MAIEYVTGSTAFLATQASTTQTLTLPSGIQQDDLILWYLMNGEDSPQPAITSNPSGYTQRGSGVFYDYGAGGMTGTLWWKIAGASESSPSVTWNTGNSNGGGIFAVCVVYRGIDTADPFALDTPSEGNTTGSSSTFTPPSVTPEHNNAMIVSFVQTSDNNTVDFNSGNDQGFTIQKHFSSTTGSDVSVTVADKLISTAAETTLPTYEQTALGPDYWAYQTTALKPPPAFATDQTAFRFYEDGTESGSTAIAAQNTNISRDVTSNSNIGLRVRIQETGGSAGASTDDYQLQYRVNGGAWTNTGTGAVTNFASGNLTDGGATTNRLGAGTGSFVAGEVSEDGLVDDHQITASNYTEYLYSLTLASASTAAGDSIEFRVLVNGATMTYSVTPAVTVLKTVAKSGTDSTDISSSETASIASSQTQTDSTQISSSETSNVVPVTANPSYRSSSRRANLNTSAPYTIPVPAGTVADDITVVYLTLWNSATTFTISGGNGSWTKFLDTSYATDTGTEYVVAWWKRATGTDSGDYTLGGWTGTQWVEAVAVTVKDIPTDSTNPIEDATLASATSSTAFPVVEATVTDASVIVWIGDTYNADADTPPTNWTERQDGSELLSLATREVSAAGTYSTSGAPGSHGTSSNSAAIIFGITASESITPITGTDSTEISSTDSGIITQRDFSSSDSTEISSSETSDIVSSSLTFYFQEDYEGTNGAAMSTANTEWELFNGAGTRTLENTPTPLYGSTLGSYNGAGIALTKDTDSLPGDTNGGTALRDWYFRGYFYLDSNTDVALTRMIVFEESVDNNGDDVGGLRLNADRSLRLMDGATAVGTASTKLLDTNPTRIELHFDQDGNTITYRMWWGADLQSTNTGATNYETGTATLSNELVMEVFGVGFYASQASGRSLYVEEVAVATGGWIGPASEPEPPVEKSSSDSTEISSTDSGSINEQNDTIPASVKSVASNNSGTGTSTGTNVTLPSGIADGDVGYMQVSMNTASDRGNPSGWTLLSFEADSSSVLQQKIYRKVLSSSDSSSSVSWTLSNAQKWTITVVVVENDGGIDVQDDTLIQETSSTSYTLDSITPTIDDALLLGFLAWRVNSTGTTTATPPTDWTEAVEDTVNAATAPTNASVINYQALSGGAGSPTTTRTDGTVSAASSDRISTVIAIAPGEVPVTPKSGSDSTEITSAETASVDATATASDTTDISTGEAYAILSTLSRSDSTEITSSETASIQSTLSRTDTTEITSAETSSIVVQISSADSTEITGTEAPIGSGGTTGNLFDWSPSGTGAITTGNSPLDSVLGGSWNYDETGLTSRGLSPTAAKATTQGTTAYLKTPVLTASDALYVRIYAKFDAFESAVNRYLHFMRASNATTVGTVRVDVSGGLRLYNSSSSQIGSTSSPVPTDQWVRIEAMFDYIGGSAELRLYSSDPHGTTPDSTISGSLTIADQMDGLWLGYNSNVPAGYDFWFDEVAVSNEGWIGPAGSGGTLDVTFTNTDSTQITSAETSSFAQVDFSSTDSTEITGTDASNLTATFPGSDATLIGSSETSEIIATGAFDINGSDSTDIGSSETSSIVVLLSRTDTTDISSAETSSFGQTNFSTSDTTLVSSTETSAILSTLSRTDTTDISSAETSAIQSNLSRTDTTDIASAETSSLQSSLSRTDTTDIGSAETSSLFVTLTSSDTTDISSTETSSFGTIAFTRTDTTDISSSETSSIADTLQVNVSDSTEISSTDSGTIDTGDTELIRYHERFNGGADGVDITSGNSLFTLFPGTGTMQFSDDHPIQGGTGGLFVSTTAAQGKRGKIEGLPSRRTWYARYYYYKTGNPSAVDRFMIFETAADAVPPGDDIAGIREEANGNLTLFNGSSWVTANPLSSLANGWHRIELKVDRDGELSTLRVWSGANMHSTGTADAEIQVALTDNGNEISVVGIGNYNAVNQTRYVEDFAVGDEDWIGPSANIDITGSDSTQISSTESSAVMVPISSADSTQITTAETSAIQSTLSRTDSTEITSTESSSFGTVAFTRTDSTEITSTESSTVAVDNPGTDTTLVSSSETSDLQISGDFPVTSDDSTNIDSAESSSTFVSLSRSDSTEITSAEASSFAQVNFTRTDSTQITSAETSSVYSTLSRTDSTEITSAETSSFATVDRTAQDTTEITSAESGSLFVTITSSDSTQITSSEASSFATVSFTTTDSTEITSTDSGIPEAQFPGSDSTIISSSETSDVQVSGGADINDTDSTDISSSETSAVLVIVTSTDTTQITSTETSAFAQVNFSASDTTSITSAETGSIFSTLSRTDSTEITSSETSSFESVPISSADSTEISTVETAAIFVTVASADTTEITSSESVSFGQVNFSATDTTEVTSTDSGIPQALFPGSDSTIITSSETSDVQISGGTDVADTDSTEIISSETSAVVVSLDRTDTTEITSSESVSFAQVNFTRTDSTEITSTDSSGPLVIASGTDSTEISSAETSDVQTSGGFDVSSSDSTEISSSESSSIVITTAISSNDVTQITSTEAGTFGQVNFTRSDATQITSTESASVYGTVTSTDSTQVTSTDAGIPIGQFPGADSTIISSSETSDIQVLGLIYVASSDSTEISSSETSVQNVQISRADSTQITSSETSSAYGTVVAADSTQISSTETVAFNTQPFTSDDSTEIGVVEETDLFILIVVTSDDSTEISTTDSGFVGEMDIGEVSSRGSTQSPSAGVHGRTNAQGHVSSRGDSRGGVSSS